MTVPREPESGEIWMSANAWGGADAVDDVGCVVAVVMVAEGCGCGGCVGDAGSDAAGNDGETGAVADGIGTATVFGLDPPLVTAATATPSMRASTIASTTTSGEMAGGTDSSSSMASSTSS